VRLLLLINGPGAAYSERFKTTLEFDEGSKMLAVACVEAQRVALKKKVIPEWLFSPVVVALTSPHAPGCLNCLTQGLTTREIRATRTVRVMEGVMTSAKRNEKQNVTISLDRKTIQKAKIFAARRSTSISGLLAHQIEILVGEEEAYERAERQAMTLLDQGFHLGGVIRAGRDELHER
jgi:hypothetical protein